ncbi:uncharacterized protein NMK_1815 [Novimethylophilus kurashikiensis]|uniref:Uncharacterized protein n=1 Tax=Novimethylophilus kurashikiensis TaxID=1825523 RepID=A0A2R5F7N1_9PROT|nr:hypothetical protein [Novimethylophilus kurashikiensis]GBG14250.1 uncharacterized protein NMK_1815 [Novimethylophilus kurashikiensis]
MKKLLSLLALALISTSVFAAEPAAAGAKAGVTTEVAKPADLKPVKPEVVKVPAVKVKAKKVSAAKAESAGVPSAKAVQPK